MKKDDLQAKILKMCEFHNSPIPSQELLDDIIQLFETKNKEAFNRGFQRGYISGTQYMENNGLNGFQN